MSMQKVLVLVGGTSRERLVSLTSAPQIVAALRAKGFDTHVLDVQDPVSDAVQAILKLKPDVVFNGLYGGSGENGDIQGVLNLLRIPYSHSGVLASAMAMDKAVTRQMLIAQDILMAPGRVISKEALLQSPPLPYPFVVKPIAEGSSVGVTIVADASGVQEACERCAFDDHVLVESWIPGREISVGLVGPRALGVVEVVPQNGFYDYQSKYLDQATKHFMPAPIPDGVYQSALEIGERVYTILGCRGIARVDFRYNPEAEEGRQLYCLELNTQPGLTPVSLLPEIAAYAGMSFEELVVWCIEHAQYDQ